MFKQIPRQISFVRLVQKTNSYNTFGSGKLPRACENPEGVYLEHAVLLQTYVYGIPPSELLLMTMTNTKAPLILRIRETEQWLAVAYKPLTSGVSPVCQGISFCREEEWGIKEFVFAI